MTVHKTETEVQDKILICDVHALME